MSRLSGPERGEQNLAKVRSYLAGLQVAGQSLPLEDGRPNISAIAEAAGVLRNVFYTNSGVKKLLAEFVGGPAPVADGSAALSRAQQQVETKGRRILQTRAATGEREGRKRGTAQAIGGGRAGTRPLCIH